MKTLGMLVAASLIAAASPTLSVACSHDRPPAISGMSLYFARGGSGMWFASARTGDRAMRLCELAHETTCRYWGPG